MRAVWCSSQDFEELKGRMWGVLREVGFVPAPKLLDC